MEEIEELRFRERNINGLIEQLANQVLNQTAIAELEKVKEYCQNSDGFNEHGQAIRVECVVDFIDCAIKDLKEKSITIETRD